MGMDQVSRAYDSPSFDAEGMLGTDISPHDPDRALIEEWADTVDGAILDVGSGTGRWTGHLTALGHDVEGLEPAPRLVALAREAHAGVTFREGSVADLDGAILDGPDRRWAGILAWYSLIHMGPDELPQALHTLRRVLEDDGRLLVSFFSGPQPAPMNHPVVRAYRWPMPDMVRAMERAGFEVVRSHDDPRFPHAYVMARAAKAQKAPSAE